MDKKQTKDLADFYRKLLEAERAGVKTISELLPEIKDEKIKLLMQAYLRDEGMNCHILDSLIKSLGHEPGNKTGDFVEKIRALPSLQEKLELLVKGQEWVARQIRYNREIINPSSSRIFLEAIKIQHEENVDSTKTILNIK
ncbi:MAG: DUF6306 domain-containing protein [Spirochaetota bacterium]